MHFGGRYEMDWLKGSLPGYPLHPLTLLVYTEAKAEKRLSCLLLNSHFGRTCQYQPVVQAVFATAVIILPKNIFLDCFCDLLLLTWQFLLNRFVFLPKCFNAILIPCCTWKPCHFLGVDRIRIKASYQSLVRWFYSLQHCPEILRVLVLVSLSFKEKKKERDWIVYRNVRGRIALRVFPKLTLKYWKRIKRESFLMIRFTVLQYDACGQPNSILCASNGICLLL